MRVTRPRRLSVALLTVAIAGCSAALLAQAGPPPAHPWNELDASWISVRFGAAIMEDGAFYSQDAANKEQVGQLSPEGLFRVDDLSLSGQIKFPHPWRYEVAGNYKGLDPTSAPSWTLTYAYLSIPLGPLGSVTIGKQKEGARPGDARERAGHSRSWSARRCRRPSRSSIRTSWASGSPNSVAGGRMTWSAGWFNNWLDDGLSFERERQRLREAASRAWRSSRTGAGGCCTWACRPSTGSRRGETFKLKSVPGGLRGAGLRRYGLLSGHERHLGRRRARPGRGSRHGFGRVLVHERGRPAGRQSALLGVLRHGVVGPHGRMRPYEPFDGGLRSDQPCGALLVPARRLRRLGSRGALLERRPDERIGPGREVRPA